MPDTPYNTQRLDFEQMAHEEWAALTAFENRIHAEMWPDEPPRSVKETTTRYLSIPPFVDVCQWVVRPAGENRIIASAHILTYKAEHNQHVADFYIAVLPEKRRQGIAKGLLRRIVPVARERNRRLLLVGTDSRVPAGAAFTERLGAEGAHEEQANRLELAHVDRDLIETWRSRAQERASEFEVGLWAGPYPEEDIEAIIEMKEVMNTAPRGDLDVEDFTWTVEHVRQAEESLARREIERWTVYARSRVSRELAGYTEVYWNPHNPAKLDQGDTAVFPKFRERGLGRWIKAAMLEKVLRDRPQVTHVLTGNANANAPMLKINHELGFKLYKSWTIWQVEVQQAEAYLQDG